MHYARSLAGWLLVTLSVSVGCADEGSDDDSPNVDETADASPTVRSSPSAAPVPTDRVEPDPIQQPTPRDAGRQPPAPAEAGTTPAATPEAGPTTPERDAMVGVVIDSGARFDAAIDAGGIEPSDPCDRACAAAAAKGCADNDACAAELCLVREISPNCTTEADAYLNCIGDADPQNAFECIDGRPQYVADGCNDPHFDSWLACME